LQEGQTLSLITITLEQDELDSSAASGAAAMQNSSLLQNALTASGAVTGAFVGEGAQSFSTTVVVVATTSSASSNIGVLRSAITAAVSTSLGVNEQTVAVEDMTELVIPPWVASPPPPAGPALPYTAPTDGKTPGNQDSGPGSLPTWAIAVLAASLSACGGGVIALFLYTWFKQRRTSQGDTEIIMRKAPVVTSAPSELNSAGSDESIKVPVAPVPSGRLAREKSRGARDTEQRLSSEYL